MSITSAISTLDGSIAVLLLPKISLFSKTKTVEDRKTKTHNSSLCPTFLGLEGGDSRDQAWDILRSPFGEQTWGRQSPQVQACSQVLVPEAFPRNEKVRSENERRCCL